MLATREALRDALAMCGIARAPLLEPAGHVRQVLTHREVHVLLFEPASTLNTGNVRDERTLERLERI